MKSKLVILSLVTFVSLQANDKIQIDVPRINLSESLGIKCINFPRFSNTTQSLGIGSLFLYGGAKCMQTSYKLLDVFNKPYFKNNNSKLLWCGETFVRAALAIPLVHVGIDWSLAGGTVMNNTAHKIIKNN